jgi:MinD-like ATPase involved in chromosome partitioning or flagellar assembly
MNVPFLGRIPLDPRLARCSDEGQSFLQQYPATPTAQAYREIIHALMQNLPHQKQ